MDNVSQTETNHTAPKRLDLSRGRRTYHPDVLTSHGGGVSFRNCKSYDLPHNYPYIQITSLICSSPLSYELLTRRRNETSDVINAIIVARRSDEASVPTQRRITLLRARFATVRAFLHPRTSEWTKHLQIHEETTYQVTSTTPTDLSSEMRPAAKESPLVVDSEILWHSA